MAEDAHFAPLDITPIWARINDELIELVDLLPEDKPDWSPKPELWNARGILLHIVLGRHGMMTFVINDGEPMPAAPAEGQTRDGLKEQLRASWSRMAPFLSDAAALDREYEFRTAVEREARRLNGHWLASGQLEHDVHHRADIYHYLGLLGIEHGEPDTIERSCKRESDVGVR